MRNIESIVIQVSSVIAVDVFAIRFACEYNEKYGTDIIRVEDLQQHIVEKWTGNDFDICDYRTGSYMSAFCSAQDEAVRDRERKEELASLMQFWGERDRNAFKILENKFDAYVNAHTYNEVHCGLNTWCAVFSSEEATSLKDEFLSDLATAESRQFPEFTKVELTKIDHELNELYSRVIRELVEYEQEDSNISVKSHGVKETERRWIKFRDAWVSFARHRYPKVSVESWKAWLTEKRIKILESM